MPRYVRNGLLCMFADDTSYELDDVDINSTQSKRNTALTNLMHWFQENKLHLNLQKTCFIGFKTKNDQKYNYSEMSINYEGININHLSTTKFLGLYIDEELKWKNHCKNLSSSLHSTCYQFRNLKPIFNTPTLLNYYYAQVYSRLSYGVIFWGSSTLSHDVFLAQKRIIKLTF